MEQHKTNALFAQAIVNVSTTGRLSAKEESKLCMKKVKNVNDAKKKPAETRKQNIRSELDMSMQSNSTVGGCNACEEIPLVKSTFKEAMVLEEEGNESK